MHHQVSCRLRCHCSEGYHYERKIKENGRKRAERVKRWPICGWLLKWFSKSSPLQGISPPSKFDGQTRKGIGGCQNAIPTPHLSKNRIESQIKKPVTAKVSSDGVLGSLPAEVLYMIVDKLDDVSAVCLKTTSSYFHNSIKTDDMRFSLCTRWLIRCQLEMDMQVYPKLVDCALCKAKVSKNCFLPKSPGSLDLMRRNPVERCCLLHVSNTFRDCRDPERPFQRIRWVETKQITCLHCGADVDPSDTRASGCIRCTCEVCPRASLPRYERYGPLKRWSMPLEVIRFLRRNGILLIYDTSCKASTSPNLG